MPFPEQFQLTTASENDLNLFKQAWGEIENRTFFGDKIYLDHDLRKNKNSQMLTPIKGIKGQPEVIKMMEFLIIVKNKGIYFPIFILIYATYKEYTYQNKNQFEKFKALFHNYLVLCLISPTSF